MFYLDGRLQAEYYTPTKTWHTYTRNFNLGQWSKIDTTWSKEGGLHLYVNNQLMSSDREGETHAAEYTSDYNLYFGKSNADRQGRDFNGQIDEVEFWYDTRDKLIILGKIDDSKWSSLTTPY